ncbi:MAG: prepilin-type N-terminal cleavage/methylation domain-containing protein [Candidatus Eisenbacteria bacterium]|jgi:prepilin-type N-terminal cleavage/methylation domain-containing protein|nr:prepilin-type N-terminal cleavage/methylation domain-containing protein [Candidatus Eisenbacteria bacterium]
MLRAHAQGFTLIELGVVLVLLGLILGIAVPAIHHSTVSSRLAVGADGVVTQLYLAREKAVDEQADVSVRFAEDSLGADLQMIQSGRLVARWSLPTEIGWSPVSSRGVVLTKDGRANEAADLILMDRDGRRDTVSVMASGMVVHP